MIFELDPYNVSRLWVIFLTLIGVNFYFIYRARILALDPKVYLIVFLSSINAFCIERYLTLGGQDVIYFIVMGLWCNVCLLLMPKDRVLPPPPRHEDRWLPFLLTLCTIRLALLDIPHLIQFVESGFVAGVMESQANVGYLLPGSALGQYIFVITLQFFEGYCFAYNLLLSKKRWRKVVGLIGLIMSVTSGYLGGSRATIFYTCMMLGQFLIYFRHEIDLRRYWWRITSGAAAAVAVFFFIMIVFSGIRSSDGNEKHIDMQFGADRVANRMFANADGIEYFLIFERSMETELYNFVKYNFVFIVKRVTGQDYFNMGRRLYQDAIGKEVNYGGANFTVMLQSRVAFGWFGLIYIPILVCGLYLSRQIYALRGSFLDMYIYNMSYCMVWFFIDSEAQFARFMAITTVFFPVLVYTIFVGGRVNTLQFFPFARLLPTRRPRPQPHHHLAGR